MKNFKLAGTIPALALVFSAGAASAASVTPDVIFGSGNDNGSFTVDRQNGIELGLRGKLRFNDSNSPENTFNYDGVDTYTFQAGNPPTGFGFDPNNPTTPVWNFEWSVNTDYDGSTGKKLDDFVYFMTLDIDPGPNVTTQGPVNNFFDPINVASADHAIGNNTTGNGAGLSTIDGIGADNASEYAMLIANNNVAQNSWSYEFFNTNSNDPTFGFDPNVPGSYLISLSAFDGDPFQGGSQVASTSININVAPIPVPAALPLLLAGLGGLGFVARRKRKAT